MPTRGALRDRHGRWAGDAVDAAASGEQQRAGRMMLKRTAKSCGSDAPMLASSLREGAQATVSNKPGHRGEREVSRKTIARGMPGETGVTVVTTLVCLFLFCMRGCGRVGRPAFPAPSEFQKAGRSWQTSREACGEIAKPCLCTASCLKIESVAMHGARTRQDPASRPKGGRKRIWRRHRNVYPHGEERIFARLEP